MNHHAQFFNDTLNRLEKASHALDINKDAIEKLKQPHASLQIAIPVRMDNGELKIFEGYRVHYEQARGPCKGGVRYHPDASLCEVQALALLMSMKCALAGIPFGGGKGAIKVAAKDMSPSELERLSRKYIEIIADFIGPEKDILAPDLYTTPRIMSWMMDEYSTIVRHSCPGVITGKPIPLNGSKGREEATGHGAYYCVKEIEKKLNWNPEEITVAIQGFGNAARPLAQLLHKDGYCIVALSDSAGGIHKPDGLDIPSLIKQKQKTQSIHDVYCKESVCSLEDASSITNEQLLTLDVDLLIPAAIENQITKDNAHQVKAKVIVEVANGPTTIQADEIIKANNCLLVPDILANVGGLIVSYFEWIQNKSGDYWDESTVFERLEKRIKTEFNTIWNYKEDYSTNMRNAAYIHALNRYYEALVCEDSYFNISRDKE